MTAKNKIAIAENLPILYSFRRCPYAARARLALAVSQIQYNLHEVVLANKPAELIAASPKATVPVLVLSNGQVIDQSLDIMLWALQQNDPENWLPTDAHQLSTTLTLIATFDGQFKYHLDRYKYAPRYGADVDPIYHRSQAAVYLNDLQNSLSQQAYLKGEKPTLSDMAIAPFVRQFAASDSAWFNAQAWPVVQRWLQAIVESPLYVQIMQKHAVWTEP